MKRQFVNDIGGKYKTALKNDDDKTIAFVMWGDPVRVYESSGDYARVKARGRDGWLPKAVLGDVGLLEMQTENQVGSPSENFGVVRLRRPVLNQFSTAGVMLTSLHGGGSGNVGLGADGSIRVRGDEYLTMKWLSSFDDADSPGTTVADRSQYYVRWDRRTGRGLQYQLDATRSGADFKPALGFLPRRDFTSANIVGNYFIFTDKHRYFRRIYPGALAFSTFRNSDGALESGQYAFWVQWDTKTGGGGWIEGRPYGTTLGRGRDGRDGRHRRTGHL